MGWAVLLAGFDFATAYCVKKATVCISKPGSDPFVAKMQHVQPFPATSFGLRRAPILFKSGPLVAVGKRRQRVLSGSNFPHLDRDSFTRVRAFLCRGGRLSFPT